MQKIFTSIAIFTLFIITIILPSFVHSLFELQSKANELILFGFDINKLYLGVIHIPSLLFIVGSLFILWLSKSKDEDKVVKLQKNINEEFQEADELISLKKYTLNDLEKLFSNEKNSYLQEFKYLISLGTSEEEIEMILDKYTLKIYIAYEKLKNDYDYIAGILPMLGMIGTIAGLLQMFGSPTALGGEDDFTAKFSGLSVALATTLYASLLTILFVKPASRSIDELILQTQKNEANVLIQSKLFLKRLDSQVFLDYIQGISNDDKKDKN